MAQELVLIFQIKHQQYSKTVANVPLLIGTNDAERMRIDSFR